MKRTDTVRLVNWLQSPEAQQANRNIGYERLAEVVKDQLGLKLTPSGLGLYVRDFDLGSIYAAQLKRAPSSSEDLAHIQAQTAACIAGHNLLSRKLDELVRFLGYQPSEIFKSAD